MVGMGGGKGGAAKGREARVREGAYLLGLKGNTLKIIWMMGTAIQTGMSRATIWLLQAWALYSILIIRLRLPKAYAGLVW